MLPLAALAVAVLLPVATFMTASWLVGWRLQVVLSGSMEPGLPVGSMVVVQPIDVSMVRAGMTVAFVDPADPGRLVTHRVVEVSEGNDGLYLRTKGDANAGVDPQPVAGHAVRGRVGWVVPHLGSLLQWLQWPRGFLLLVVLPAALLAVTETRAAASRRAGVASPDAAAGGPRESRGDVDAWVPWAET
ncbi:MAG: signal peptidase I [Actinomycetes bacterium]